MLSFPAKIICMLLFSLAQHLKFVVLAVLSVGLELATFPVLLPVHRHHALPKLSFDAHEPETL
jgi:hypothetical protein